MKLGRTGVTWKGPEGTQVPIFGAHPHTVQEGQHFHLYDSNLALQPELCSQHCHLPSRGDVLGQGTDVHPIVPEDSQHDQDANFQKEEAVMQALLVTHYCPDIPVQSLEAGVEAFIHDRTCAE